MDDNFQVVFLNLPYKINGFTLYNASDDYYTIILNSRMSYGCWKKTFRHELQHITNDDFVRYKNVSEIEMCTHV